MLNRAVVNELVHKCDVVYHLAAAVGVRLIVEQPVHTLVTNLQGTEIVLEHCNRFGKRVLIASTSEVYGDHRDETPLEERPGGSTGRRPSAAGPTPTRRRWTSSSRWPTTRSGDLDCVIARLFNTVGPRQSGQYGMVVPRFVERALPGEPLEVYGDGKQTRCFCHVSDTIRALHGLMDAPTRSGEIYNVGSTEQIAIVDLAQSGHRRDGLSIDDDVRPIRGRLRSRDRGHAPPHPLDRRKFTARSAGSRRFDLDEILADVVRHLSR